MLAANGATVALWGVCGVCAVAAVAIGAGLYMLEPKEAAVLTFFGDYRGTDRASGLRIANPLYSSYKVSLRVRNFNTATSKVNDANGNPINIAAVVVWRVVDTVRASFGVNDFEDYVYVQSESAVRQLARQFPYESFEDPEATTLIGEPEEVNQRLQDELQERADAAGVDIVETRVTDLSYAVGGRRGDAPPPAGVGDRRRPQEDRRGRGGDRPGRAARPRGGHAAAALRGRAPRGVRGEPDDGDRERLPHDAGRQRGGAAGRGVAGGAPRRDGGPTGSWWTG